MRTPEWFKKMAAPLADKIVYASDAYVGLKSTINDMSNSLIDFSRPPAGPADERLLEFAQLIRPWTYDGLELIRVGGDHDGGYVMADDFNVSGAISIGVGRDVSWDIDIAGRGIPVVMFDPTIRRLPETFARARFLRVGLGDFSTAYPYRPLEDLLARAGFSDENSLLLKIDIEGGEYRALSGLCQTTLRAFRQITIEFHNLRLLRDPMEGKRVVEAVRNLTVCHLPIHIHGNNYDCLTRFDSWWFPNAVEVTFLRRDCFRDASPALQIRHPCDQACDPRVPDFNLESLARLQ